MGDGTDGGSRGITDLIPADRIAAVIRVVRGHRVIVDADLAALYGVPTGRLNEAVKRNRARFPADFVFRLTAGEWAAQRTGPDLRSHLAIASPAAPSSSWGGRRTRPYAFTEHGLLMAANVLNSPRAVAVSILVVRQFVRLRALLAAHDDLARKLDELETKYDRQFAVVFDAIRELMDESADGVARPAKPPIGFRSEGPSVGAAGQRRLPPPRRRAGPPPAASSAG